MDSNNGGRSSHGPQNPMQTFGIPQMTGGTGTQSSGGAQSVSCAQNSGGSQGAPHAQNSEGAKNSSEAQRQTAAQLARNRVLEAYGNQATNSHASQATETHLKSQPVATRRTTDDWRKYHTAWQSYYQKYYNDYYANAARAYVEKERLKDARRKAEDAETIDYLEHKNLASGVIASKAEDAENDEEIEDIGAKLKNTIRKKAVKNVRRSRRVRRLLPFLAGAFVVLFILFMQYNRLIFAPIFAYVSPGNAPASEIEPIDPTISQAVSADPRLIIPKLNIDVPIAFGIGFSDVMSAMNSGVAHYRIQGASAYPGEIGNTVITGHSAGDVYSSNPYKYIFSGLERLEDGDLIYVNYESVRYTYQVTGKAVVEPTDVEALQIETDVPMLTLVTCTPLGTSRYRLLVFAEQISPSANEAEEADTVINVDSSNMENAAMPSNEPEFFEGIWNFLTGGAGRN